MAAFVSIRHRRTCLAPDGATAFDRPESTYPPGDGASVTLETRGREVEIRLIGNPVTLDGAALEQLIAALESIARHCTLADGDSRASSSVGPLRAAPGLSRKVPAEIAEPSGGWATTAL
jgi:hypothetical protein